MTGPSVICRCRNMKQKTKIQTTAKINTPKLAHIKTVLGVLQAHRAIQSAYAKEFQVLLEKRLKQRSASDIADLKKYGLLVPLSKSLAKYRRSLRTCA